MTVPEEIPGRGATPEPTPAPLPEPVHGHPLGAASGPPLAEPVAADPASVERRSRPASVMPFAGVIGFLILALAIFWVWRHPLPPPADPAQQAAIAALDGQVAGVAKQLRALDARTAALAARKPPAPPKPVDLGPIEAQLATLAHQKPAPPPDMATKADLAALSARIDALGAAQASVADMAKRVAGLEADARTAGGDLAATRRAIATLQAGAARIARLARLQAAQAALGAGAPLGSIDGAPPALARFATDPPPTLSALRLAYPAAARAAASASRPDVAGKPLLARMWARVQTVVTVKQGDRVVVGDPAEGVLAAAQSALDAGDLAGAVQRLGGLQGSAAAAIAAWLDRARALLAAQAALATMQAHA